MLDDTPQLTQVRPGDGLPERTSAKSWRCASWPAMPRRWWRGGWAQRGPAPGQPAHWANRGRVGSMRDLVTWSTQERSSTSRSVPGKPRVRRFTP